MAEPVRLATYLSSYYPPIPDMSGPMTCLPPYFTGSPYEVCIPSAEAQEIVWAQVRAELTTGVTDLNRLHQIEMKIHSFIDQGFPQTANQDGWQYIPSPDGDEWLYQPPGPLQRWLQPIRIAVGSAIFTLQNAILAVGAAIVACAELIITVAAVATLAAVTVGCVWMAYDALTDAVANAPNVAPVALPANVDTWVRENNPVINWTAPEGGLPALPGSMLPGGSLQRPEAVVTGNTPEALAGYPKFTPKGLFIQNATENFTNTAQPEPTRVNPGIPVQAPGELDDAPYGFGCSAYGPVTIKFDPNTGPSGIWSAKNWDGSNLEWALFVPGLTADDLPLGTFEGFVPETAGQQFTLVQLG
jgi:hypothetical protein